MTDLGWAVALFWSAIGSGVTLIAVGTRKKSRRRRNRRVGLPAPECQRVPAWHSTAPMLTRRQAE